MSGTSYDGERHGAVFWIAFVAGVAVVWQFGLLGLWHDLPTSRLRLSLAKWIIGADVVHDLLIAPLACVAAAAAARWLPQPWRQPVEFGGFASAVVVFVVQNALRGTGRFRHNPTIQPLHYWTSTGTALAVVWAIALTWGAGRARRARHASAR